MATENTLSLEEKSSLTLSYPGEGEYAPLLFFLGIKAQGIKLKLSDFKDTLLRHILQVR